MNKLIEITDSENIVSTKDYPYANWDFEQFNCVQSSLIPLYDQDVNGIVAASTSAGKTVCSELFLAHEIRKRKGKGMMLVPIRALAQERYDDWTRKDHHFGDLKVSICTGDYRLDQEKMKGVADSDLVIMTSEMLNSRSRNDTKQSNFIKSIKTLIVDESHLITTPGRGDHLEVGLIKFLEINPDARVILLSATMPNVKEIAEWMKKLSPNKDCFILNSKYRPCPLNVHYEKYYDGENNYSKNEREKVNKALDIIDYYPDDKFLVFVHTKKTGELVKDELLKANIETEFHNANLEKDKRIKLESRFKSDPKFRVIVATSTLACGLNLPARRVIITGVHRGLEEVEVYNINQMCGRAGRPRFDKAGDAYILIPESRATQFKEKLKKQENIESQLLKNDFGHYKVLAFHIVNEIFNKSIKTTEDIHEWYRKSLCYFQSKDLNESILDKTIDLLKKRGVIYEYQGEWKATAVGRVSSMYYFPPLDVADLKSNLLVLVENGLESNDYAISMLLGNLDSHKAGIISRAEKDEVSLYSNRLDELLRKEGIKVFKTDSSVKTSYCYYNILNSLNSDNMNALMRGLQMDAPRVIEVLKQIDAMDIKEGLGDYLNRLLIRLQSGVPSHFVDLCFIKNIGKQRAKKLYENNVKNLDEFLNCPKDKLVKLLNMKVDKVEEILLDAKKLSTDKILID